MKRTYLALSACMLLGLTALDASAQRNFGAQTFTVDDNAQHEILIQTPAGMTGNLTYTFPLPPAGNPAAGFVGTGATTGQTLRLSTPAWTATSNLFVTGSTKVGMGLTAPESQLHIRATPPTPGAGDLSLTGFIIPSPEHHVLTVENMNTNGKGQGIAVVIRNPASASLDPQEDGAYNNSNSNYVTFYGDNGSNQQIRGRIEGFSYQNMQQLRDAVNQVYTPQEMLNPLNYVTFNVGFNPNFMTFDPNFINFTLPSWGNFSAGSLGHPEICYEDVTGIPYPCGWCCAYPPSLDFYPPSLTFSNPFPSVTSPLTNLDNPFSFNTAFINSKADQLRNFPWKNAMLDMVSNPLAAAVKYSLSFFVGGVTYESGAGDYAEWLERADANEKITVADVVAVNAGSITKNTDGASQLLVTSFKPIVLGNSPAEGREHLYNKVAFLGQVPVKARGNVSKGDFLVASGLNDGSVRAIARENITADLLDKVVGVSWHDDYSAGPKAVKIAVGLKPMEMVKVIQNNAIRINNLKAKAAQIKMLQKEVDRLKIEAGITPLATN